MYNQAFDLPDLDNLGYEFQHSDIAELSKPFPDHLMQVSISEKYANVNDSADNKLESWSWDPTCSLAEENLLGLDSFRLEGSNDSPNLDPWYGALTTDFDLLPKLQTEVSSLDLVADPCAAGRSMLMESSPTDTSSSTAVTVSSSNSYQPTPALTECSSSASLSVSSGSHDLTIGTISKYDTENQRWHATLSRSRTADRYFLYGVLTTRIFCRPSCASRRPSRRHVRFFSFPGAIEAAEQAKFRPCKRCKPETLGIGNTGVIAISHVLRRIIAETFERWSEGSKDNLKLESLAKSAGLSIFHFHRLFKATTQVTPADFITACHALSLQDNLCTYTTRGTGPGQCAVLLSSHWSERTARKALGGLNPAEYASGAKSTSIEHCCVSSPVGDLEVAYSGDKNAANTMVHAVVLSQDLGVPIGDHFWTSKRSGDCSHRLQQYIRELEEKCQDRDVELAADVLSVLWRARLWLSLTQDNKLR